VHAEGLNGLRQVNIGHLGVEQNDIGLEPFSETEPARNSASFSDNE